MIDVMQVTKRFDGHVAICNLSFRVAKGSVYGLVGPNGAGKTTIIKHIVGAYRADKGTIKVDGEPVYENVPIKRRVVYIPDDLYFPPAFSAKDMARLYSDAYPQFCWERFEKLAPVFGIDPKKRVRKLSKGMQKQVAFWVGMSALPDVLILDEPVDGLDPVMRRMVWSVILQDVADRQLTVLVSSHNLRELEDVCDHVGILHAGQLMLQKALDDLKSDTHKIQVAFDGPFPDKLAYEFDILAKQMVGKVYTIIVRCDRSSVLEKIEKYHPILLDVVPLTLEEVFIYELGGKGYDFSHILG